jgi:pimeloyl-ACP methyl ester carboxylesterase
MERVTFKNSRNLTLVGNFRSALSKSAIVLAHGFTSDKSSDGRFDRLGESLHSIGYSVLAFDFSGCGESDNDILDIGHQIDDLNSAISFVQSEGAHAVGLHGHSLGSLICLKCFSPMISTMVLTGALIDGMQYDWSRFFAPEQVRQLDERGYLVATDRTGKARKIGRQILEDFALIDQETLLQSVACPVLIIHGNNPGDREELQLLERSRRGMKFLCPASRLEVIEGGNHGLREHYDKVVELAKSWFLRHLPVY